MKQLIIGKKAILNAIANKTLIQATISNKDSSFFQKVKFFLPTVKIVNDKKYYDKMTNNCPNHQLAIGYINDENVTNNFAEAIKKIAKKIAELLSFWIVFMTQEILEQLFEHVNVSGLMVSFIKKINNAPLLPL